MLLSTELNLLLQLYNVEVYRDTFEVTLIIPENFITIFVQNIGYLCNYDGSDGNGDHDDNDNNEVNYPHAVVSYLATDWLVIN